MGAFRGLVVDALWLRADRLKEQGQFFDAKQIAEWITRLQPRFAQVWEFQGWNMAYNISVAIPAAPETQPDQRWKDQRWQWVKNGYELLRDKGIPLNPKSVLLYRELARIFQHKIGSVSDEAHEYYKLQLVMAMEPLLGDADNREFAALAAAAADWQQIIKDADVARLITALKAADKAFADADNGKFVSSYLSLRQSPRRFSPDAFKTIDYFRGTEALEKFDVFARAYQLRNVWKLDPVLMQQLNKTYGPIDLRDPNTHLPLDWRHPDSHAIYWAVKGLQTAGVKDFSVDEANTDRIVNHSLQNLFRYGKIFIAHSRPEEPPDSSSQLTQAPTKEVFLRPDLRMFEPYNKSVLAVIEKYKDMKRKDTLESLKIGHRNMLINALSSFYQAGHKQQAQKIYNQLKNLYPDYDLKDSLEAFVKDRLHKELQTLTLYDAAEIVQMMLRESYFRYAMRDDDEAFVIEKMAKEVYDRYQSTYDDQTRIDLPDFRMLRYFALRDFFDDQQYPLDLRRNLLGRIKIERPELAEQLKQQEEKLLKELEQSK
jgi:hypothetical protein